MPLTKVKSRSRCANTATVAHQESANLLHEPGPLSLDKVQLGNRHMPPRSIGGVLDGREVFLGHGAIQFGNKSLLGRVEVLG
ncbi:MAG: hypothetical protein OXF67_04660 [Cyanobacteria bacterium MAG CAR4_bin_6]|nr:hypothetical protein [Cyanobacteria bacterium MAG CAR4_bin_6]